MPMLRLALPVLLAVVCGWAGSSAAAKPNVLFVVSDDLNCDLGCYGHPLVQSPHIDRLAKRGLRFENAYCQYPVCNPSRSSFITGLYPEQTGVLSNGGNFRRKHPDVTTLPQLFTEHGYYAARIGKIYHYGVPLQIGTDGADDKASWQEVRNPRGIDRDKLDQVHTLQKGQYGGTLSWLNIESQDTDHTDGKSAVAATELLRAHDPKATGKPFFLAVGFYRPHTPYVAPSHYFDLYPREQIRPVMEKPGDRDDIPRAALADRPKQRELTVPQRQEIIQAYYASISLMDAQVGRLLDALDELGLAENTIVVFLSDHGYHLGAHGLWQKSDLFEGSARVPLIMAVPGMKHAGESTKAITELVDLYPTLADLCELPKPDHLAGASLVPVLDNPQAQVNKAALTVANSRGLRGKENGRVLGHSIRTPRYRYTEWGGGKYGTELYDYQEDPEEYTNLADKPEQEPLQAELKELLAQKKHKGQ